MIIRLINLKEHAGHSLFLWGPRQTGKSTLLRSVYRDAHWLDLLKADEFRRYLQNPEFLRQELLRKGAPDILVIDEIQKVPALLDEVHWLIENRGIQAILCGSSARKVKRGHANLLGGRAIRRQLFGLTAGELGSECDMNRLLNHGYLPRIYLSTQARRLLNAYVADYLKEEVAAEGLVRNLPVFSEFLNAAALSDTELVNYATLARDCGISAMTIKSYFDILVDTLQGSWLPSYRKKPKRRVTQRSKFYFSDVGVVNFLARRGTLAPKSELYGKAFENWVMHELNAYNSYRERFASLTFWRLANGTEVDFIVNDMEVAIEAKATERVRSDHFKGLRQLQADHPHIKQRIVVCLEPRSRLSEDGIDIYSVKQFICELWAGHIF